MRAWLRLLVITLIIVGAMVALRAPLAGASSTHVYDSLAHNTPTAVAIGPAVSTSQLSDASETATSEGVTAARRNQSFAFLLAPVVGAEAGPDFVAGPIGSEPPVPVSQSRMATGFDEAGFPSTPTASPGVEYTLPDSTKVRLMEPSGQAPMRASLTNANGGPINPFTGKPVQPPAPPGWSMKDWVRALTHVEQTP